MSSNGYKTMLLKDSELLLLINNFLHENSFSQSVFSKLISKNPWQDICFILVVIFIFGVIELRLYHFWVVIINLFLVFVLRKLIAAKRPIEIDPRFSPQLTDLGAESYGFPSLETHMSVVICGHITYMSKSWIVLSMTLLLSLMIGLSRIYSRSRFPHQIIGSLFTGFLGLSLGIFIYDQIKFHLMSELTHGQLVGLVIFALLINVALSMEDNSSRFLGVRKQEFIRLMRGILFPNEEYELITQQSNQLSTPRSSTLRQLQVENRDIQNAGIMRKGVTPDSRDSFYFLQRTLELRNEEIIQLKHQQMNRKNLRIRTPKNYDL